MRAGAREGLFVRFGPCASRPRLPLQSPLPRQWKRSRSDAPEAAPAISQFDADDEENDAPNITFSSAPNDELTLRLLERKLPCRQT